MRRGRTRVSDEEVDREEEEEEEGDKEEVKEEGRRGRGC